MKNLKLLFIPAIALLITFTGGCSSLVIQKAPIHEVNISIAESYPPQVLVYIKGGLADSCTSFHELTTKRKGNIITIEITTERPKKQPCAQVYGYFEKNVNLGSDFTSGESYTIIVNDETFDFTMP